MEFNNLYLTYEEYQDLGGTLAETPFNLLEYQAQLRVDDYTFGRLKNLESQVQQVKLCIFELMSTLEGYAKANANANKGISSENIDGYSVSYSNVNSDLSDFQNKGIRNIIEHYLSECKLEDGTPYLYLGR